MPGSSEHKIMVVDDDDTGRESLAVFLHAHGYEVSSATDGYDALWKLKNDLVDIVISDLEMPGLSGAQFFALIRERFPELLVIAMTGTPGGESRLASANADGSYPKAQQSPKKLLSTIAELLRGSTMRKSVRATDSGVWLVSGDRSDTAGTSHVLRTCRECLTTFSIKAPKESASREARDLYCVFCGKQLTYSIAFSDPATSAAQTCDTKGVSDFGFDNLFASARNFASLIRRRFHELRRRLANSTLRGELPELRDSEHTQVGTQISSALNGENSEHKAID